MGGKVTSKLLSAAIMVIALVMIGVHVVVVFKPFADSMQLQNLHLGFALTLVFLQILKTSLEKSKRRKLWPLAAALLIAGWISVGYVAAHYTVLQFRVGLPNAIDVVIGSMLLLVVVVAVMETWGREIFTLIVLFMLYFFFGQYLPVSLSHPSFDYPYIVSRLSVGLSGIYGTFLNSSVMYVFLFMVFGGILKAVGALDFILDVGRLVSRVLAGGSAQTAVIASALVGTVSGTAVGNVAMAGTFTIPAMKRAGYPANVAGGIEACASTGGQITPPVLGASAFVMAILISVDYGVIVAACIIPAVFYFLGVGLGVELWARKRNFAPSRQEVVNIKSLLQKAPPFVTALVILFVLLMKLYSPNYAISYSLLAALVVAFMSKQTRPNWAVLLREAADGAIVGAKVGIVMAGIGIIAQTLYTTGLGVRLTSFVEAISGGMIPLLLFLTMVVSLILGCGLPTIGAYTIVALIIAPALTRAGLPILPVHFFAFFFAIISAVTPPVAVAAITAAGISGGQTFATEMQAMKFVLPTLLIPIFVMFNPAFTLTGAGSLIWPLSIVAGAAAMASLTAASYGYLLTGLSHLQRLLLAVCGLLLVAYVLFPANYILLAAGTLVLGGIVMVQWRMKRVSHSIPIE